MRTSILKLVGLSFGTLSLIACGDVTGSNTDNATEDGGPLSCEADTSSFIEEGETTDLALADNGFAYGLTDRASDFEVVDDLLCAFEADAEALSLVGCYSLPKENDEFGVTGLTVSGDKLFVTRSNGPLYILDIEENPAEPVLIGQVKAEDRRWRDVFVHGDIAIVSDGQYGLDVVDVSDPTAPEVVGFYSRPMVDEEEKKPPRMPVEDVAFAGDVAVVAAVYEGLFFLDLSDPTEPRLLSEYAPEQTVPDYRPWVNGVEVVGDRAYLAVSTHDSPLHVLDISEPTEPTLVHQETSDVVVTHPYHMDLQDRFLALGGSRGSKQIVSLFSLGSEGAPNFLAASQAGGNIEEIEVLDDGTVHYAAGDDDQRHSLEEGLGTLSFDCR